MRRRPFGSWLLGPADQSARSLRVRTRLLSTVFGVAANLVGSVVVIALAGFVLPGPGPDRDFEVAVAIAIPTYVGAAFVIVTWLSIRTSTARMRWVGEDRAPTRAEQVATLRLPLRLTLYQAAAWGLGTVVFVVLAIVFDGDWISRTAFTVPSGGLVTCAYSYLLTEFAMRPVAARALESGPPERLRGAGLLVRMQLFWAAGSAIPAGGLIVIGIGTLMVRDASVTRLCVIMIVFGGITLLFGWLLTFFAANAVVDPVRSVRSAMHEVARGRLDVTIPVYDGTEIGSLQDGFNQMAAGLRERDRIRDLFGRYVGHDVARDAIDRAATLGGQERFAAVLFVDIVGSTGIAAQRPPGEVVHLLNRFFNIVVDEVDRFDGFVNKFEGDAILAVFGAPMALDNPAASALAASRSMRDRLASNMPDIRAAIGVAAGEVVAGTVGDERRLEYTVIGDPVNEAARLTEVAKSVPGLLAASMSAVEHAGPPEAEHWCLHEKVVLRGRTAATAVATAAG